MMTQVTRCMDDIITKNGDAILSGIFITEHGCRVNLSDDRSRNVPVDVEIDGCLIGSEDAKQLSKLFKRISRALKRRGA